MPPSTRHEFITDLRIVQAAQQSGIVANRAAASGKHWDIWMAFCTESAVDPWFSQGGDPIPYLQVFAQRLRDGRLSPSGRPIRCASIKDILRSIGQGYCRVGAKDIRLDAHGKTDFRLSRQLRSYTKEDPPSLRVKPIPIQVVTYCVETAYLSTHDDLKAMADMICIGFYFLMRPGEHTLTTSETPFHFADVKLYHGNTELDLLF